MTLRAKLLLAQLPLVLSLLVLSLVARRTVLTLDHNAQDILKDNHQSVLALQRMRDAADALERAALAHVRARESNVNVPATRAVFDHELAFQEGNITELGEREATEHLRVAWTTFQIELEDVLPAPSVEAERAYFARLEPALIVLRGIASEIVTLNQDAMVRKSDRARKSADRVAGVLLAVTLAVVALGFWGSTFFTHRLTRPLAVLAQAVRRLGQGDLVVRARLPGKDEIAQVAAEFNTMAERLAEYRSSSLGELLEAQQAAQAAIDSLPDPVLVLHLDGSLVNANAAAGTMFDIDAESADGLAEAPVEIVEVVARMQKLATRGGYVPKGLDESIVVALREGAHSFLPRSTPVHGENGETVGFAVVLQDVTRLRRFDELKTDLVATVAHEFRTPLTSLRLALHLVTEGAAGALSEKQADLLHASREDTERLQSLVDDILDVSRIQSGKLELHAQPMSSAAILAQALEDHRTLAKERQIQLRTSLLSIDRAVLCDVERARLVLANLVTNALRHTPAEGIVELRAAPDGDFVRFEVSDSGPGIPATYLPRLFDRFFRVPGTSGGGVGLGLFIAKEIVEAHGGHIGAESDEGAIFWFTLPVAPSLATSVA